MWRFVTLRHILKNHDSLIVNTLKVHLTTTAFFNKDFLKNFKTAEVKNTKLKPILRQIDSESYAKYGVSASIMNRVI